MDPPIDMMPRTPTILVMMPLCPKNEPPDRPALRCGGRPRRPGAFAALCVLAVWSLLVSGCVPSYRPEGELVFEEEFDGQRLDTTAWRTEMAWGRYTTGELQHYDPGALRVNDGQLDIVASRKVSRDREFASGAITSLGTFEFTYGYVEMRARMPEGQGLWPALWLAAVDASSRSEIDVVEFLGHEPDTMHMALHFDDETGEHHEPLVTYRGEDFTQGWHTYAIDWTPDAVVWYVDGVERSRQTRGVPDEPMYLIANMAVGGVWPGEPDETTEFPATYAIDHIRVYER